MLSLIKNVFFFFFFFFKHVFRVALFRETTTGKNFIAEYWKAQKESKITSVNVGNLVKQIMV
jgi:hypothetical protein